MPRLKRIPPAPKVIGSYNEGIVKVEIIEIDEESESYGTGASAKVRKLKNYNQALEKFANEYFWGEYKSDLKPLIHDNRQISALSRKLTLLGINLEDRALRALAKEVRKAILALENCVTNNSTK
jgi:hypothetical protein